MFCIPRLVADLKRDEGTESVMTRREEVREREQLNSEAVNGECALFDSGLIRGDNFRERERESEKNSRGQSRGRNRKL